MPPRRPPPSKGKGKAPPAPAESQASPPPPEPDAAAAQQIVAPAQRQRVAGGNVIKYWVEPDGAPQRGYSQDKWDTACRELVLPLCNAEDERRQARDAERRIGSNDSAVSDDLERDAALIMRELDISKASALATLRRHDGQLFDALDELTRPPKPLQSRPAIAAS